MWILSLRGPSFYLVSPGPSHNDGRNMYRVPNGTKLSISVGPGG